MLNEIDLSQNPYLKDLDFGSNPVHWIDLSHNDSLDYLFCRTSHLDSLDVSANAALTFLNCGQTDLEKLDISNNTQLTTIYLFEMPYLEQVCVWTTPFPPEGVTVSTTDSPNAYFNTECGQ